MPYLPLASDRDEIRVLSIAPQPELQYSGKVVCTLEQVSLQDLNPLYKNYISAQDEAIPAYQHFDGWARISRKQVAEQPNTQAPVAVAVTRKKKGAFETLRGLIRKPQLDVNEVAKLQQEESKPILIPSWRWSYHRQLTAGRKAYPCGGPHEVPKYLTATVDTIPIIPRFSWGDFEALSYCWESENLDCEIILDSVLTKVPRNLEAALRALRHLPENQAGNVKFWVDYLCINQKDTEEKNHQVKLMRSVYGNCLAVISWLGPQADDSVAAIKLLWQMDVETYTGDRPNIKALLSSQSWQSLLVFLSRNYWQRLWIIQELVLNNNLSLFICGNEAIPRSVIVQACHFSMENIEIIDPNSQSRISQNQDESRQQPDLHNSIWHRAFTIQRLLALDRHANIDTILDLGRKANATYARDKVYGLLALLPETLQAGIQPDCTPMVSPLNAYTDFANRLLQNTGKLDSVLSWCFYTAENELPSWVPDWRIPFKRHHLQWFKNHSAGKDLKPEWRIEGLPSRLICRGMVVDSIATTGFSLEADGTSKPSDAIPTTTPTHNHYGSIESTRSALARTLDTGADGAWRAI
ncbi:hypothetical protein G7Y89_g241 [Cudoniella acicularis]|uniref:Heterokaryon incompatibility domain-containing protein n=1 Tax=Cudoniella acicularis TaxID=354080 RepID=A0A8H4RZI6_9HELO|nr:hypothetical protein G7Y89_g241 [Cudoniella acicularis]